MKINTKKLTKITQNSLVLAFVFVFLISSQVFAADTTVLTQVINAGSLGEDIVDASGVTVASPAVTMGAVSFSFSDQTSSGQFGTTAERVRVSNPTATEEWTVSIAASATTAVWTDGGSSTYDFNDASGSGYTDGADTDSVGGQMTIDPSGGSVTGVDGCATTGVNVQATPVAFEEGTTDSVDLMIAGGTAAPFCQFDFIGDAGNVVQKIPASTIAGTYTISLTVSVL